MPVIEIIYCDERARPSIVELICADQNLDVKITVDRALAMKLSKGTINPSNGVIVRAGSEMLRDYFNLVKWINEKGLKLL